MHSALWLLLYLSFQGRLRRMVSGLRSPRGIIFAVIGVLVLMLWIVPSLLTSDTLTADELAEIRRIGPLALLGICLLNVLFSSAEGGIAFTAAETSLLFPAPFSRRQFLAYKVVSNVGAALLSAAFVTIFVRRYSAMILSAFVAVTMILTFIQLLGILLALLASTVGAVAYNRQRRILLGVAAVIAGIVVWQTGADWLQRDWLQILDDVLSNPIAQIVLAPMQCFIDTLTAQTVWPDLLRGAGLSLLVNVLMILVIFSLDAQFLEASAAASEKLYMRLQRVRQGGTAAISVPSGKPRLAFPFLPRLGGIGPLVWRQLTTALRSLKSLILMLLFFGIFATPLLLQMDTHKTDALPAMLVALLTATTLIVPPLLPFDFRGDLDRMPFLKTLPLPAWRITIGELLTPVILLSAGQCAVLAVVQFAAGLDADIWGVVAVLIPINFLIFTVENFFFLLVPIRQVAAHPGDFQLIGRNIVVWLAKMTAIGLTVLPATIIGLVIYFVTHNQVLAIGSATVIVVLVVATGVPLVAWAFLRFDVARDTPPE